MQNKIHFVQLLVMLERISGSGSSRALMLVMLAFSVTIALVLVVVRPFWAESESLQWSRIAKHNGRRSRMSECLS